MLERMGEELAPFVASVSNDSNTNPSLPCDKKTMDCTGGASMIANEADLPVEQAGTRNQLVTLGRLQTLKEDCQPEIGTGATKGNDNASSNSRRECKDISETELAVAASAETTSDDDLKTIEKHRSRTHQIRLRQNEENGSGIDFTIQPLPTTAIDDSTTQLPKVYPGAFAVSGSNAHLANSNLPAAADASSYPTFRETVTIGSVGDGSILLGRDELIEACLVEGGNDEDHDKDEQDPPSPIVVAEILKRGRTRTALIAIGLLIVVLLVVVLSFLAARAIQDDGINTVGKDEGNGRSQHGDSPDYACFQHTNELQAAVHEYHRDNTKNANVSRKYGWPIGSWCVTPISDFHAVFLSNHQTIASSVDEEMFFNKTYFHEDIGDWDMSNALEMEEMLRGAKNLSSKWGIQHWNTSTMSSLKALFMDTNWTEPLLDLGTWDVSRVETMNQLFRWSTVSIANISGWNTGKVQHIGQLAELAESFNDDISGWETHNVVFMYRAFKGATSFQGDLSKWNTSSVVKMEWAFAEASSFNSDLSRWDVSRVDNMFEAFKDSSFNQDISEWLVSSATDLRNMFSGATSFRQDLCSWGSRLLPTANISGMFTGTNCPNHTDPVIPVGPFCFNCDPARNGRS